MQRIAFLGDSIVHGGKFIQVLQLFENLRHPGSGVRFVNVGRSGGSAGTALQILDAELKAAKPDRVIAMFGMNDVSRGSYANVEPIDADEAKCRANALDRFRANIIAIAGRISNAGIPLTLMTPTPYDQYGQAAAELLAGCNEPGLKNVADIVREVATERNLQVIDLFGPMTAVLKAHKEDFVYSGDRVHPDWAGHMIAASLILDALGDDGIVTETEVDAETAMRGFKYAPKALPYPVTPEYETVDRLIGFTEKHNREILKVRGLAEGRYTISFANECSEYEAAEAQPGVSHNTCRSRRRATLPPADVKSVRTVAEFSAAELAGGVNIAVLDTPNQLQAQSLVPVQRELQKTLADYRNVMLIENMLRVENVDPSDYAAADAWLDTWLKNQEQSPWYLGIKAWVDGWRNGRDNKLATDAKIENLYDKMAAVIIPHSVVILKKQI